MYPYTKYVHIYIISWFTKSKSQIFFREGSFVILILNWGLIRGAYAKIYFGLTSRRLLIHLVAICNDNFSLRTRQATRIKREKIRSFAFIKKSLSSCARLLMANITQREWQVLFVILWLLFSRGTTCELTAR